MIACEETARRKHTFWASVAGAVVGARDARQPSLKLLSTSRRLNAASNTKLGNHTQLCLKTVGLAPVISAINSPRLPGVPPSDSYCLWRILRIYLAQDPRTVSIGEPHKYRQHESTRLLVDAGARELCGWIG